jgi:hypothetical protein
LTNDATRVLPAGRYHRTVEVGASVAREQLLIEFWKAIRRSMASAGRPSQPSG